MKVSTALISALRARSMATPAATTAARGASLRQHQTMSGGRPRVVLCADFDETITERDTIQLLFRLAGQGAASPQQHAALVQRLVERYASEVSAFLDTHSKQNLKGVRGHDWRRPNPHLVRALDVDALDAFLEDYAATDWRSVERVIQTRALRGIAREKIRETGRSIAVRDGCTSVLSTVPEVHVVSTNWSAKMICAALSEAAGLSSERVHICANGESVKKGVCSASDQ